MLHTCGVIPNSLESDITAAYHFMQRDPLEPPGHNELCVEELNIGLGGDQDSDGQSANAIKTFRYVMP